MRTVALPLIREIFVLCIDILPVSAPRAETRRGVSMADAEGGLHQEDTASRRELSHGDLDRSHRATAVHIIGAYW